YGPKAAGAWPAGVSLVGPAGATGSTGPAGSTGATGSAGAAATVSVGTVTTGAAGSSASVTNTGTSSAAVLAFSIPRGDTGATGSTGPSGVVSATAPITYNSGTQTVGISAATTSAAGSMSAADKVKLDAISGTNTGDQTITLTGEVTGSGTGSFATTLSNSAVIGKVLTGYTSGAGTVAATDTILQAIQKLNGNDAAFLTSATAATTYQPLTANLTALGANNVAYYLARANHTGTQAFSTLTAVPAEIGIACSDETTNLTTGTAKVTFRMPYAMTLTSVKVWLIGTRA
ncbi:MAG: hypothetical protein EBY66_05925, partial [Candidatus Fonsibacter lacus]|nr:hypothetical protein [Candidatus Fonsibacter lacus]